MNYPKRLLKPNWYGDWPWLDTASHIQPRMPSRAWTKQVDRGFLDSIYAHVEGKHRIIWCVLHEETKP
jgi:hypothetical protein